MAFILFGVLFLTLLFGIPIGVCMGLSVLAALTFGEARTPNLLIVQRMFTALDNFPFMAVPFFILAGDLMQGGGISGRLINFLRLILGRLPARMAMITTVGSGFFGAISGSNPATVAAIGGVMIPEMKKIGYTPAQAGAIAAASGTLGVIIPPSISMITYSLIASVSVGGMFLAGIAPGVILGLGMVLVSIALYRRHESGPAEKISFRAGFLTFVRALPALLMPAIILGGIYGSFCTPTEAAAISCVYAFLVSMFVYRDLAWRELPAIFIKSAANTAIVLFIVAVSSSFSWLMTSAGVPGQITAAMLNLVENKYAIFLMMNVCLLFLGCFLETQSIILLMTPILLPLAVRLGMEPIALGLIIIINTSIGMITPPMAVNLFVASGISGAGIGEISRKIAPYFAVLTAILLFFTYAPSILTFLPALVGAR